MTNYKQVKEERVGKNIVRIHYPNRTEEEQKQYEQNRYRAMQRFGREMVRAGLL